MTARWLVIAALAITMITALLYHARPDRRVHRHARRLLERPRALRLQDRRALPLDDHALDRSAARRRVRDGVAAAGDHAQPDARPCRSARPGGSGRASRVIGLQFWFLDVATVDGADPWLFRGGFLVTAVATMLLIAAVTHRYTITSRVLALRPLLWIGTRSYGLYLFHWPIYQIIRKVAGIPLTWPQFVGRDAGHGRRSPSSRTGSSRCRSAAASSASGGIALRRRRELRPAPGDGGDRRREPAAAGRRRDPARSRRAASRTRSRRRSPRAPRTRPRSRS